MTYGKDLKECAVRFFQNNHTYEETEEVFGMAKSTLYEWVKEAAAGRKVEGEEQFSLGRPKEKKVAPCDKTRFS
jgi:transposase-like protein